MKHLKFYILLSGIYSLLSPDVFAQKTIAISFDDAPRFSTMLSGEQRSKQLILQLQLAKAPQSIFFCNSSKIETEESKRRLFNYAKAGHLIANHGHAHIDANKSDVEAWSEDFLVADRILKTYLGFSKFYRFPYLRSGEKNRDSFRRILNEHGYRHGYVTIDTYDYYMDYLVQKAVQERRKINMNRIREQYIKMLVSSANFYENLAKSFLNRSPSHVILLHENDLAALFIGDLVHALREDGWEIIPILKAYKDPIAGTTPNTTTESQGQIVALALEAGISSPVISPYENEDRIEKAFRESGAIE